MSNPTISLLMPVYNGANFIQQSLSSILEQSTSDVEVILIDDGSKDNTVSLVHDSFKDAIDAKRLVILLQKNQGVSSARNYGLNQAHGDYVGFVDADDVVFPDYIKTVLSALSQDVDIIEFGLKKFVNSIDETISSKAIYSNNQFGRHSVSSVINRVYGIARWYPVTRVFKKKLFEGIRFPEGVSFCEDLMTIPYLYEKAQTILVLKKILYGYRTNLNSATYQVKNSYVDNLIEFYGKIQSPGLIRHQYLRMAVAFAITSCQSKSVGSESLPDYIQRDLYRLRWLPSVYYHLKPRMIAVLLYPKLYKFLLNIFRTMKSKRHIN